MTVPARFARAVYRQPDCVAVRWEMEGEELTWADYGRGVREVALGLVTAGVARGDRLAVGTEDTQTGRIIDLAVMSVGAVSVVDGARADLFDDLASVRARGAELDRREPDRFERERQAVRPDDPALAIGGAAVTHANLVWTVRSLERLLDRRDPTTIALAAPFSDAATRVFGHLLPACLGWRTDVGPGSGDGIPVAGVDPVTVGGAPVYGPAAACGVVTVDGWPIPGVTVAIADNGEVLVSGGNVAPGSAVDGWLHTDRTGDVDAAGRLRYG